MRQALLRASCMLLLSVAFTAVVFGRKWTDSTGRFSIDGEFVALKDGIVTIRRIDGKSVRVSLEKLSNVDQEHVRDVADGPDTASPFEQESAIPSDRATEGTATLTIVLAEGVGTNEDEALKDAFRNAVRQVVGAVVDAETLIKNDDVVEDKVLTYSGGLVKTWRELPGSKRQQASLVRLKISAEVERRSVITKLKAANITVKDVDGKGLFAEIVTELDAAKDARSLQQAALKGFPANVVVAEASEPKAKVIGEREVEIIFQLSISVDVSKYDLFQKRLIDVLDHTASPKGQVSLVSNRGEQLSESDRNHLAYSFQTDLAYSRFEDTELQTELLGNGGDNLFEPGLLRILPDNVFFPQYDPQGTAFGRAWFKKGVNFDPDRKAIIAVNTSRTQLHDRTNWNWYHVDAPVGIEHLGVAVRSNLLADDGTAVASDVVSLRIAPSLVLSTHPYQDEYRDAVIAYISPYFFEGRNYTNSIRLLRKLTLTPAEVKTIKSIRCVVESVDSVSSDRFSSIVSGK